MEENIIILDNKIHFYEQLYKSWCKKIDSNMKNVVKKINNLDKRVEKLEIKIKKNNEIIILLFKKINQKSNIEERKIRIYNYFQNNVIYYIQKISSMICMFILFIFYIIYIIYK
jgi:hypothetical protein